MANQRRFAVFDIDGTVIRWQLYHSIVSELAKREHLSNDASDKISQARMTWKNRSNTESYSAYEKVLVETYYGAIHNVKVDDFESIVDHVFEEYKDQVYTYTRDLLGKLKAEGYLLFTISGSHHEIIEKLAHYYGFDDYVGNLHERDDETFTGNYTGTVHRKGEILTHLVNKHNATFEGSIAVGDSESDIAMFELVENPIVFNPTRGLFAHAKKSGWQVVVERKNMIFELQNEHGQYILKSEPDDKS